MRLLAQHEQNWTPLSRCGVFLLLKHGEVVHIGHSNDVFGSVMALKPNIDFEAFSWLTCLPGDVHWLANELTELYQLRK